MKNSIIGKITSIIGGVPRDILHVQQRLVMQQIIIGYSYSLAQPRLMKKLTPLNCVAVS